MIPLKSKKDLEMLKEAGSILAGIMQQLQEAVKPGMPTKAIDDLAAELINERKVSPAFLGYRGYPASVCVSVNEEIVHGIPGSRVIKDGDMVSIDLGIKYKGYYADQAVTLVMGEITAAFRNLIEVTRQALDIGIEACRVKNHLTDISAGIQEFVERNGFSVVRQFVGHGIGKQLHEEPEIPNFGKPGNGPELEEGMVFAIEPMVNMGSWEAEILENGWTAVTKDRLPSCHFEHTVAITKKGPEILTD